MPVDRRPSAVEVEWPAAYCFEPLAAVRAAYRARSMPRKETQPKARLMELKIILRAWSCPWQHPKRYRLINPISAQSDTNCLTLRENSPRTPTTRPIVGGIDRSKASTGQGSPFQTYSIPLNSRSALWALVSIVDWTTQAIGQQHTSPLRAGCEARRRAIVVDWTTSTGLDYLSSSRTPTRALLDIQSGTSRRVCLFVV